MALVNGFYYFFEDFWCLAFRFPNVNDARHFETKIKLNNSVVVCLQASWKKSKLKWIN